MSGGRERFFIMANQGDAVWPVSMPTATGEVVILFASKEAAETEAHARFDWDPQAKFAVYPAP